MQLGLKLSKIVKLEYKFINESNSTMQENKLEVILKLKVPNKMRMLDWLMHGRILCNAESKRRHMMQRERYPACSMGSKTVEHVFRICIVAELMLCGEASCMLAVTVRWIRNLTFEQYNG